tara:strand:- start:398 stop:577 length:180 start_codon:yes stop_codon:yes gene_type:complete
MSNLEYQKMITAPFPRHNGSNPHYKGSFFAKRSEIKSTAPFMGHEGRWFFVSRKNKGGG